MDVVLIIFSAALYSASNYYVELYFLNWFFLLPFLYYLLKIKQKNVNVLRGYFFGGWQLGFFIFLFSANFLYNPIKLYTDLHSFAVISLIVLLFLFLSLPYGLFMLIYIVLVRKWNNKILFHPFLFASSWLVFEYLRYYLMSFFPFLNPAYSQAEFIYFIQLSEYGGIWILTFILILVNGLVFEIFSKYKYKNIILIITIFAIIFGNGYYKLKNPYINKQKNIKIGIITTQIKQDNKWRIDKIRKNNEIVFNSFNILKKADLIIAPETNLTFDFHSNNYYRKTIIKKIKNKNKTFLQVGALASQKSKQGQFNSVFLISPEGKILKRYNKNLLVLFGEQYPRQKYLNKYTPFNFNSLNFGKEVNYFEIKNIKWKTVICSEILYPHFVKVVAKDLDFIINQTNEAWFDSALVKNIMWQAAVLRAVENRKVVIKTGNKSYNGIIFPSGKYKKMKEKKGTNYYLLDFYI